MSSGSNFLKERNSGPPGTEPRRVSGFTLVEMLIAMLLTALIGLVLFSTYRNVAESRKSARLLVEGREHPRMLRAVLEDDFTSLQTSPSRRLPLLSRAPVQPGERYLEAAGPEARDRVAAKKNDRDELLFSFAGTSGLHPEATAPKPGGDAGGSDGLFCIEYVVRDRGEKQSLIRRERPHCGVEGIFFWDEDVMLPSVHRVRTEVWPAGGSGYTEKWQRMLSSDDLPRAIRFRIWHTTEDRYPETLVIALPERKLHAN